MEYRLAQEIADVAEDLIFDYHEDLADRRPRIEWLFARASSKSGKAKLPTYKIRKITGLNAFLATSGATLPDRFGFGQQDFAVVEVGHLWWMRLDPEQQKGFVDHALSHLTYDHEKGTWTIEPPEYGEFPEVLERHGFWRGSLDKGFKEFAEVVSEQLSLLPEEDEEEGSSAEPNERDEENLQVSIAFGGKRVDTDTATMRRVSEGLANGEIVVGPGEAGEQVDGETGEVLEEASSATAEA